MTVPTHTRVVKEAVQEIVRRHALPDVTVTAPDDFQPRRVHRLPAITAGEHNLFPNPLRDFYQAPVVDISAAAGLAVGYYVNFVLDVASAPYALGYSPRMLQPGSAAGRSCGTTLAAPASRGSPPR